VIARKPSKLNFTLGPSLLSNKRPEPNYFLASHAQTHPVGSADMRSDLKEGLMNVAAIFVDSGAWATISTGGEVELEFGK
jgi:hypothetical protein